MISYRSLLPSSSSLLSRSFSSASASLFSPSASSSSASSASAHRYTDLSGLKSKFIAILGAQWGDEGKGKLVDILAQRFDIISRFNGGANAGHTLVVNNKKFAFHLLPCGMLYEGKKNLIGNGVVLDMGILMNELNKLEQSGIPINNKLLISNRAHLLFQIHKDIDGRSEAELQKSGKNIGTTKKGIGPCYASKSTRNGVRVGDLIDWKLFEEKYRVLITSLSSLYGLTGYDMQSELEMIKAQREKILPWITDTSFYLNNALKEGKSVLAEGANAALLDIDHGTYPYVTSSATAAGGICTGLGVPPSAVQTTFGVVKAYTTRVGSGPFPTELSDSIGEEIRSIGREFGTTTGRPRRCGWLDIPVLHYSNLLNGYTAINVTKLDVLSGLKEIKIGVAYKINGQRLQAGYMPQSLEELSSVEVDYETVPGWQCDISKARKFNDLPHQAQHYLKRVEELVGLPINYIGVGADREDMATKGF